MRVDTWGCREAMPCVSMFMAFSTYLSTSGSCATATFPSFGSIFFFSSFLVSSVTVAAMLVATVENSVSTESRIKTATSPDKAVWDEGATTFNSIGSFASIIDLAIPETGKRALKSCPLSFNEPTYRFVRDKNTVNAKLYVVLRRSH